MNRIVAWLLISLAGLMTWGFFRGDASLADPATWLALVVGVAIPGAVGIALIRGGLGRSRSEERLERLRKETLDAELLRLAAERGGKITVVEAVTTLGISPDDAREALSALVLRDLADIQVSDSGLLVYAFPDVRLLHEKSGARDVLDA